MVVYSIVKMMLQNISKERILLIRQIIKRDLIPQTLVQIHRLPPPILPPENEVQRPRRRNRNAVADNQPRPQLGIMATNSLRLDKLRPDNIANGVRHKHRRRHDALLGRAGHVAGPQRDDQADDWPEETC